MKYVKPFAIFESEMATKIEKEMPKLATTVEKEISKLSDEQKATLAEDLAKFASNIGLKPEELTDSKKVAAAMAAKRGMQESEELDFSEEVDINEGLKEWWQKAKDKFSRWMIGLGITSMAGGILTTAIWAEMNSAATTLLDYVPNGEQAIAPMAAIGLAAGVS